jgi:UDP-N-acetylmuramoyl-tripeptide--D-alanyl-D-alanine ligase
LVARYRSTVAAPKADPPLQSINVSMHTELLYQRYLKSSGVSTDTRQITPGSVFFALKGPKYNANEFAADALDKGASAAIVDDSSFAKDERFVVVDDTLKALQLLAKHHRGLLKIPVLALTGSNGKTTSKELVHAVLSTKLKVLSTKGNLNNHIGVPLTILSIGNDVELAVIEMGANHVGEIAGLCEIANPTHGFITNIGKAHIGTFGGFENIIRAKSELYQHLITHDGTVFINSQNVVLSNMAKRFKKPFFYPAKGDYYYCELIGSDPFLKLKAENGEEVLTQLTGAYNFENAAAALCIAKFFSVDASSANNALRKYAPSNMRSQILTKGTNTIILDAYNANPSSMAAAIDNLASMKAASKVLILGDMFELEEEAEHEHMAIVNQIEEKGFSKVYLCGSLFAAAASKIPFVKHFTTRDELISAIKKDPISSSTILLKASRGMGLEKVVDVL